jgi:hypothetical protein
MKKYSINGIILLSFLNQYGSEDYIVDSNDNAFILIEDNTVFLEMKDKKHETNNTISSMNTYIEKGILKEIK